MTVDTTGNLETKGTLTLQYTDTNHKHAVTSAGGNNYGYDANGNMTTRDINSGALVGDYVLSYDAENRLVNVTKNGNSIASFVYDGDGRQVKATMNSVTTTYVGGHYEVTGSSITKYYFAGATRVALRKDGVLNFLLSDHLGSSSVTTDANGTSTAQMLYTAWGGTRYASGNLNTDYEYTGQRNESEIGLHFYNARWYDDQLGRFAQADSIIPPGVQGLDRYAYVNNNPLLYTDPSGHTCILGIIIGAFGGSYSCPTDAGNWVEDFDPVPGNDDDIGFIYVPVAEDTDIEGFDRVPEENWIEGFGPVPPDDWQEGYDRAPGNNNLDGFILHSDKNKPDIEFIKDLMKQYGLDPNRDRELRRKIHDWISDENLTEEEIEIEIKEFAREKEKKEQKKQQNGQDIEA